MSVMMRAASSASSRLYERLRNEPYRNRIRGLCDDVESVWGGVMSRIRTLGRTLATAPTAVLPEVVSQRAQGFVVGRVVVEGTFVAADQQLGLEEPLQMMAQRRRWEINVALDLARRGSLLAALHDEPENG